MEKEKEIDPEVQVQDQYIQPIEKAEWIVKLAKSISQNLANCDTLSKE